MTICEYSNLYALARITTCCVMNVKLNLYNYN